LTSLEVLKLQQKFIRKLHKWVNSEKQKFMGESHEYLGLCNCSKSLAEADFRYEDKIAWAKYQQEKNK